MAATTSKTNPVASTLETAAERVAELNEKTLENGKKTSATVINSYEKAVTQLADVYEKTTGATKVEWVSVVASAQADFAREVTKAYSSAARDLVAS